MPGERYVATRLTLKELIEAASQLTSEERVHLVRALTQDTSEPEHDITELRGLGKEVWGNIDAQEYVDAERDSWDS
jgi:hypothetical protein